MRFTQHSQQRYIFFPIFDFLGLTDYKKEILCVLNTHQEGTMRTNIDIDDKLLKEAFSVSLARTKKDLIHQALREFIRLKKRKDLTELAGSIKFHKDFDYKKLRAMRR